MRISELASRVGVPTTTVRFYERIGLLDAPARTDGGYRDYDEAAALRLLFIHQARGIGITCEQIADLLPVWDGVDCAGAQQRVAELIREKRAEIARRIAELKVFARQLDEASAALSSTPAPATCCTDLSCCVPARGVDVVPLELATHRGSAR